MTGPAFDLVVVGCGEYSRGSSGSKREQSDLGRTRRVFSVAGGGPNEDNLSRCVYFVSAYLRRVANSRPAPVMADVHLLSYLLKAGDSSWEDGIVALEAGALAN